MTLLTAAGALYVLAAFPQLTFDKGVRAYEDGDYAAAAAFFEELVAEEAVSAPVFFNLGNAYFKDGLLGPAVLNYERALSLDPGLREARGNLDRTLRAAATPLPRPPPPAWEEALLFWDDGFTRASMIYLALGCWVLLVVLLSIRQWRPFPYWKTAVAVATLLAIVTGLSVWAKSQPPRIAVSLRDGVPVRYGMSDSDEVRFRLTAGDRIAIEEDRGDWMRIRTAEADSPRRGWVDKQDVMAIGPPYTPLAEDTAAAIRAHQTEARAGNES